MSLEGEVWAAPRGPYGAGLGGGEGRSRVALLHSFAGAEGHVPSVGFWFILCDAELGSYENSTGVKSFPEGVKNS